MSENNPASDGDKVFHIHCIHFPYPKLACVCKAEETKLKLQGATSKRDC